MEQAALVFDLDGTLVDSHPDLRAALNEICVASRGANCRQMKCDA